MDWFHRFFDRSTTLLALIGALAIVAMVVHIAIDIIARTTLSVSIPATLELVTRYYMITLALLPLAWVEWRRQMIFVEIVGGIVGKSWVRFLDALVALLSAGIYLVLAVATWGKAMEQYGIGAYILSLDVRIPVWPTYFALPVAFLLAALVSLSKFSWFFKSAEVSTEVEVA